MHMGPTNYLSRLTLVQTMDLFAVAPRTNAVSALMNILKVAMQRGYIQLRKLRAVVLDIKIPVFRGYVLQ